MADLSNELSWSVSRHQTLQACPRRYYYRHYKHWGGWDPRADPAVREVYRLTKLEQRPSWTGSVMHRTIADALTRARRGTPVTDTEPLVEGALARMRQDFRDSRDDVARVTGEFKRHVRFVEHERWFGPEEPEVARQRWKEAADRVRAGLTSFFASELHDRLIALPADRWIEIEDPTGRSPLEPFVVEGVKVHAKIDCAIWEGEGTARRAVVIDWKTGKRDYPATPLQLAMYALWLHQRRGVPLESIAAREVNVVTGKVTEHALGSEERQVFLEVFRESVAGMKRWLLDEKANVPLAEGEFTFTEDERECRWCVFRSICPRVSPAF